MISLFETVQAGFEAHPVGSGICRPGRKRRNMRETDNILLSSAKVKNACVCAYIPSYAST